MGGKDKRLLSNARALSSLHLLFLLFSSGIPCIAQGDNSSFSSSSFPFPPKYIPPDNYLSNCGSPVNTLLDDGRTFLSDPESSSFLSTDENISTSVDSLSSSSSSSPSVDSLPLYLTARIFQHESTYEFPIFKPGRHWLRLYFHPLPNQKYNLLTAVFSVTADTTVVLNQFSVENNTTMVFKDYLINISSNGLPLKFSPIGNSFAFINAIELISAPDSLIPDSSNALEV
ncbi:hypothetical protein RHMOL_Rhmol08G0206400 [Rhododendron molle]|uniref:Uncharacterized protein n=1 Tax=Rhododendron molle TaxID=49168 RepID=A0ACC0MRW9_RHOML|nr:hypothetical protein RHMOL_Rhmol08G0206400 [Rhododendron molle]